MKNFAHLKNTSPFHPLFEHGMAPIKNWLVPQVGNMEGVGRRDFYMVDVSKLSEEQIKGVAALVAAQCSGTAAEVEAYMRKAGEIPLRAVHCHSVSSDSLAFL